jgi:hypothetical protein
MKAAPAQVKAMPVSVAQQVPWHPRRDVANVLI